LERSVERCRVIATAFTFAAHVTAAAGCRLGTAIDTDDGNHPIQAR
jgi:hypothetical protein